MKKLIVKSSFLLLVVFAADLLTSTFLYNGLKAFMGLNFNVDTLFTGHSHTICAIDTKMFEGDFGGRATKLAMHGMNLSDRYALLRYYYNHTAEKPKIVVVDIDVSILSKIAKNLKSQTRFYPLISDKDVERYIVESGEPRESVIARKLFKTLRYNNSWTLIRSVKGVFGVNDDLAPTTVMSIAKNKVVNTNDVEFDEDSERTFVAMIDFLSKQNAKIVLAYYPRYFFNERDESNYRKVIDRIEKDIKPFRKVYLLDYNKDFKFIPDIYYDPYHVNRKGQEIITRRIADDLRRL